MSARRQRIARILTVERNRVTVKERELVEARRLLETATAGVGKAKENFAAACDRWLDEVSIAVLEDASDHRQTLLGRIQRAEAQEASAREVLRARERALVEARIAERRIELLLEGIDKADDVRERKAERRAADEHAARKTG
jgi:flagellar biosynthesis chaperone FliJ